MLDQVGPAVAATALRGQAAAAGGLTYLDYLSSVGCAGVGGRGGGDVERSADGDVAVGSGGNDGVCEVFGGGGHAAGQVPGCGYAARDAPSYLLPVVVKGLRTSTGLQSRRIAGGGLAVGQGPLPEGVVGQGPPPLSAAGDARAFVIGPGLEVSTPPGGATCVSHAVLGGAVNVATPPGDGVTELGPCVMGCVPQSSPEAGSIYPSGEVGLGVDTGGCFAGRELHLAGGPLAEGIQSGILPPPSVTPLPAAPVACEGDLGMVRAPISSYVRSSRSVGTPCTSLSQDHPEGPGLRPSPVFVGPLLDPHLGNALEVKVLPSGATTSACHVASRPNAYPPLAPQCPLACGICSS